MNFTNLSMTSPVTPTVTSQVELDIPYVLIVVCGVIIIFGIISFIIGIKTKTLMPNIRYMSGNIIFYDICVAITYVLHYTIRDSPTWFYHRATQYSVLGQWLSVMGFIVERLYAINSPIKYRAYFRKAYVKAFIIVELSCYTVILVLTAFFPRIPERAMRVCWVAVSLHTIFSIICLASCIKTIYLFKSSLTNGLARNIRIISKSKETISIFCILFVVLHIPIGIETIALRCDFDPNIRLYTSYLIIVNSAIDPIIYVWKFRGCRLQALSYLSLLPCFRFIKIPEDTRSNSITRIGYTDRKSSSISTACSSYTADRKSSDTGERRKSSDAGDNKVFCIEGFNMSYQIHRHVFIHEKINESNSEYREMFDILEQNVLSIASRNSSVSKRSKTAENTGSEASNNAESNVSYNADIKASGNTDGKVTNNADSKASSNAAFKASNNTDSISSKDSQNADSKTFEKRDIKTADNMDRKASGNTNSKASQNTDSKVSNYTDSKSSENTENKALDRKDSKVTDEKESKTLDNSTCNASYNIDSKASNITDSKASENTDNQAYENTYVKVSENQDVKVSGNTEIKRQTIQSVKL